MNTIDASTAAPSRRSQGRRLFDMARVVVALFLTLVVTVSLDLWVRFAVLPFRRTPVNSGNAVS